MWYVAERLANTLTLLNNIDWQETAKGIKEPNDRIQSFLPSPLDPSSTHCDLNSIQIDKMTSKKVSIINIQIH